MPALPTVRPSAYFAGARFMLSRQTCACDGDEEPDQSSFAHHAPPPAKFPRSLFEQSSSVNHGQRPFTAEASANQGAEYGDSRYNGALFKRAQLTGFSAVYRAIESACECVP